MSDRFHETVKETLREKAAYERRSRAIRDRALENAERREWAHKKYGDERRAPLLPKEGR